MVWTAPGSPSPHCGERVLTPAHPGSPFVVLAGEGPIDQLTDGACFTQVIQQDHQWDVPDSCFPVYLVGQVGEIQLQILKQKKEVGQHSGAESTWTSTWDEGLWGRYASSRFPWRLWFLFNASEHLTVEPDYCGLINSGPKGSKATVSCFLF